MTLLGKFVFESIGQGLFYQGQIGKLTLVYDCGSTEISRIQRAVADYVNGKEHPCVDLLTISHLHYDHVNGIDSLFNSAKIRYVFLPYLLPIQRLLLASCEPEHMNSFYYDFLADPVTYLVEKGAERVVLVGDSQERTEEGGFPDLDQPVDINEELDSQDLSDDSILLPDDSDLSQVVKANEPQLGPLVQSRKVATKAHFRYISIRGLWILRFYATTSKKRLGDFTSCVMRKFNLTSRPNCKTVKKILSNKSDRKKLRDCYDGVYFHRLNDTSLAVFHGPLLPIGSSVTIVHGFPLQPLMAGARSSYRIISSNGPFKWGCLLTGDVDLKSAWHPFSTHFSSYFSRMTDLLIPHHGSKLSWDSRLLKMATNSASWFVSAGIGNKHGHPNANVLNSISGNGKLVFWSNQFQRVGQELYT